MSFRNASQFRRSSARSAIAVVELAVCLPVLMLIVIATIESSAMIFLQQSLSIAAYEGTRVSLTTGATNALVEEQVELILDARDVNDYEVSVTPADITSLAAGQWISVEVDAPYGTNSLMGGWLFSQQELTTTVQMMKERGGADIAPPEPDDDDDGGHHGWPWWHR